MTTNNVGKFQILKTLNDFDSTLIELYGLNMTDAHITRFEALAAIESTHGVRAAAVLLGQREGWVPLKESV